MSTPAQRHGISFVLNLIVSVSAVCSVFWFLLKPFVVEAVADELTTQIEATVAKQIEPTNVAFAAVLRGQIRSLRNQITSLEYRKEYNPASWTVADANELQQARADLQTSEAALRGLQSTVPNGAG